MVSYNVENLEEKRRTQRENVHRFGVNARIVLHTDYVYVLSQSIRTKDTEHGFIYPIDKSLLCKMRSRTVRCAKLT